MKKYIFVSFFLASLFCLNNHCVSSSSGKNSFVESADSLNGDSIHVQKKIITGADQTSEYLGYLKGKRIGILVNQTSIIGNTPIVDRLVALGVNIVKIFGPEHGFRGTASNE